MKRHSDSPPPEVLSLARELLVAKPIRRGSFAERFVKCGKKGCPCADEPQARHGPYFSVARVVGGKTQSRWVSEQAAPVLREQIEEGRRFRERVEEYSQACERWADAVIDEREIAAQQEGEKRGFTKSSRRRSGKRSSRS